MKRYITPLISKIIQGFCQKIIDTASLAAFFAMIMVLFMTWVVESSQRERFYQQTRLEALYQVATLRARLAGELHQKISLTKGLEAYISVMNPNIDQQEFEHLAQVVIAQQPSIHCLVLYKNSVITHVYPLLGHEKVIGWNSLNIPSERKMIEKTIYTRKTMVVGPMNWAEGEPAFLMYTPIFLTPQGGLPQSGAYWGGIGVIIDHEMLFKHTGIKDISANFRLAIREKGEQETSSQVFFGAPEIFEQDPVIIPIILPLGVWQLAIVPSMGWPSIYHFSKWFYLGGTVFAFLLGITIFMLVRAPLQLKRAVETTTEAFCQAEDRLNHFLDAIPIGVVVLNPYGSVFYRNQQAKKILGDEYLSFSTSASKNYPFYHEETQQKYPLEQLPSMRALRGEHAYCKELEIHHHDHITAIEMWATPIWNEQKEISFSVSVIQDISERKRTQNRLYEIEKKQRESLESQLRDLAATVPGVIYQWYERDNEERGFYYVSARCKDFYGIEAADLLNNWKLLTIHPEDLPKWKESVRHAVEQTKDWCFEGRFVLSSGEVKWWRGLAQPVPIDAHETVFNGIIIDISEQKALEYALRESQQLLLEAIETINDGFVYYNPQRQLVFCNSKFLEIYQESAEFIYPGACFEEILVKGAKKGQYGAIQGQIQEWLNYRLQMYQSQQALFQQLGNGHWLKITERDTKGGGCVGLHVDVTDLKTTEEQLSLKNLELQVKNRKLEKISNQLIDLEREKFHHELIKINQAYERFVPNEFLKLLDKQSILDVKLGDQIEKEMTVLFSDIRRFTTLSEKMPPAEVFDFVNTYLGQMEPVIIQYQGVIDKYIGDAIMALFPTCADDAVHAAITMLRTLDHYNLVLQRKGSCPLHIGIGLHTGTVMVGIIGGEERMDGTVIADAVNLASRVEGLTKTYGTPLLITEQTYLKLLDPLQYHIRVIDAVKVKGKSEVITVYEIYDADPLHILELKDQTRDEFEEAFVLYHWGEFEAALPMFQNVVEANKYDEAAQIYLERCQRALSISFPTKAKILVVDDFPENIKVLLELFTLHHFEVLIAKNGPTALEIAESQKPQLILLDIMMPEMDGFETCQRLKEDPQTKEIPVIFMTALTETMDKIKGFQIGAVDYITKPFAMEEVLMRVRTHIQIHHLQEQLRVKNLELEGSNVALRKKVTENPL